MYSYTYDAETGGIILNFSPTGFSKEPRPVYARELDVLGFDKYWKYENQNDFPYMWAEANSYYYRGQLVAKLKGGDLYTAPEIIIPIDENGQAVAPEEEGDFLKPVDIKTMVDKNKEVLEILEQTTVKKILNIYSKYKNKLDCFHVAFSGGKDSMVLLDLVKKALPKGSFVVIFGDTGMEFPDTYVAVEKVQKQCLEEGVPFYTAKSHLTPEESWKKFGPPSRTLRWCCSVHKSTPQTIKLREITGKNDYSGLAFVGVRAHESVKRSEYEYFNDGKKVKGQYSHNSILEWTSAEVWLYTYANNIIINDAYKKGNSRAGCLLCPMSIGKSDYIKQKVYQQSLVPYINNICEQSGRNYGDMTYVSNGGWVSRRSGRDLIGNKQTYFETIKDGMLIITVKNPKSEWKEWIKTLGNIEEVEYRVQKEKEGYKVVLDEKYLKSNPTFGRQFKQVFRKASYCIGCGVCQSNCKFGCIKFDKNNAVKINDCKSCKNCHDIVEGCLLYSSLRIPKEEKNMSINCFDSVLPKNSWFENYFQEKNNYWNSEHGLGPNQVRTFKRFLKDSLLSNIDGYAKFAELIFNIGWDSELAWGLLLINLVANNPQIRWYTVNLDIEKAYQKESVISMLQEENNSLNVVKFVYSAYAKLMELPLGTALNYGYVTEDKKLVRTKCNISDARVVLYGLFKFAEQCNDYKEFTLATLMNDSIERDGISPTRIFGIEREEMIPMLLGLSAKYPDFINASFTHDLEKITLSQEKTSQDVLNLFTEEK